MKPARFWTPVLLILLSGVLIYFSLIKNAQAQPVIINQTAVPPVPTLNSESVVQGEILYAQYCAVCHGANLAGASNWKQLLPDGSLPPPPHDSTGHTWHHSDELLISIILNGGDTTQGSKMPAFKNKLTEEDAISILEFIKTSWGREEREFQWWITARPE